MKNLREYVNEKLYETNTWTYMCTGYNETIDFFTGTNWNPHDAVQDIKDKFVVVNTNKNLNTDRTPVYRAWQKKYGDSDHISGYTILFSSVGDKEVAKKIVKIGKALDTKKITMEQVSQAYKKFKGPFEDAVDFVFGELKL